MIKQNDSLLDWARKNNLNRKGPVAQWVDGYFLGNGDLGAVVYGSPENFTVSLSKNDVWDRRIKDNRSGYPSTTYDI